MAVTMHVVTKEYCKDNRH